jgi:hypothetical protein
VRDYKAKAAGIANRICQPFPILKLVQYTGWCEKVTWWGVTRPSKSHYMHFNGNTFFKLKSS